MKKKLAYSMLLLMIGTATVAVTANTYTNSVPLGFESVNDSIRLATLNSFWAEVSRTVRTGDFEGYSATCHKEGVLVSGSAKTSVPLNEALEAWKTGFVDTKAGKTKANVAFRFSQRIGNENTAHETGIFHYTSMDSMGTGSDSYVHFEALLVTQDSGWKILMEYQKSEATKEEWDALE